MKILRAIGLGILVWILIFVEISIFQVGLKLTGLLGNIIHYILLIPIGILASWLYYKSKDKIKGTILGIMFIITGVVLDLIITIPMFLEKDYSGFFSSVYLWIGFVVLILVVGIYDKVKN